MAPVRRGGRPARRAAAVSRTKGNPNLDPLPRADTQAGRLSFPRLQGIGSSRDDEGCKTHTFAPDLSGTDGSASGAYVFRDPGVLPSRGVPAVQIILILGEKVCIDVEAAAGVAGSPALYPLVAEPLP